MYLFLFYLVDGYLPSLDCLDTYAPKSSMIFNFSPTLSNWFSQRIPTFCNFFSKNKQMGNIAKPKSIKITRKIHQESLLFMLVRKCFQFIGGRARSKEIINKWLFYHEGFQVFQLSENTNEILKDPYHGEMETAENRTYRTLAQSLKKNSCRLWRTRWSHHYRR